MLKTLSTVGLVPFLAALLWWSGCDDSAGDTCTGGACMDAEQPPEDGFVPDPGPPDAPIVEPDPGLPDPGSPDSGPPDPGPPDVSDNILIALADLSTTATFYSYQAATTVVKYFAVLDASGDPHVAFDACDVCYGAKKGYSQDGDEMVCNACGNRFPITGIGTENFGGGCWPGYLGITLSDTHVVIEPETLEQGSWYFP